MSKNNTMSIAELTDWFYRGKYGIMMHFLGDYRSTDESWDEKVNAFDCEGLAKQLHECGANHLLFTISQCGGRFCMPIASYDKVLREAGMNKKLCSDRDLVADLITALDKYGINLMLYAAAEGPIAGELVDIFPWSHRTGPGPGFTDKYFTMLREISLRYGEKVRGWWIDGCYPHYPQFSSGDLKITDALKPQFSIADTEFCLGLTDALQAGNPNSMVALNPGIVVSKVTSGQEYTCGEADKFNFYPEDRFIDGAQWHVLTYLGPWWGDAHCGHSTIELVNYTKACTDKGGVLTFDISYGPTGLIVPEHFDQLKVVKRFVKDMDSYDEKDIPESENYLSNLGDCKMDEIPADYVNIALGKACTASSCFSDDMPGNYPPEAGVDGDLETGWAPGQKNPDGIWWQVDLGKTERIDGIEYFTRQVNNCERRNFEIRASNDPEFKEYTVLYHQGDFPLPMDMHWSKLLDGQSFRYVRLQENGRYCIPFVCEMRVYQKK